MMKSVPKYLFCGGALERGHRRGDASWVVRVNLHDFLLEMWRQRWEGNHSRAGINIQK